MANGRNLNGTFGTGNPGGPGRPRRAVERQYLAAFAGAVTLDDWRTIIGKAVADAKAGDGKARDWLSKYLVGDEPLALVELTEELQRLKSELGVCDETGCVPAGTGGPTANGSG